MKNSGPLTRYKPLAAGDSQLRRTPMPTGKPLARKVPATRPTRMARPAKTTPPKAPRYTGAPKVTLDLVDRRDARICQVCGQPGTNRQHREGRGAGGRGKEDAARTNGPAWLFWVCGHGNASGCHQAIDNDPRAYDKGWRIRRNGPAVDAATIPVLCYDGWRLFTDDGKRAECAPPEGWAA